MAEANGGADQAGGAQPEQIQINVVAQYTKDLSFEAPESPAVFGMLQEGKQPEINVNINVRAAQGEQNLNEVVLHIDAKCTVEGKTAFIVELDFGGLVQANTTSDQLQFVLLVEVPRMLFPFARNIIAEVTRDGGFMPLMLGPVDFLAMMRDSIASQADAMAEGLESAAKADA